MPMKKIMKWVGIAFAVIIVISIIGSAGSNSGSENTSATSSPAEQTTEQESAFDYEILSRKEEKTVENISVLIQPGETQGEAIANEIKTTCKKPCNISLYDDRKAFDLQTDYDNMMGESSTTVDDLEAWKKQNYVFVADHHTGYMDFDTETYSDYPFRDWYYKELKGE